MTTRSVEDQPGFHSLVLMLRGRAGLTQTQLARALGVSERSIQVWEAGLGFPTAARLQRIIGEYLGRHAFTAGRETEEAEALWRAALAEAPRLKSSFDTEWFAELLLTINGNSSTAIAGTSGGSTLADWGDAPAVAAFHGRLKERQILRDWLLRDDCRLVGVCGMGGMGKTALASRSAQELASRFDAVFWRSLRNAPSCAEWLAEAILFLSEQRCVPGSSEAARSRQLLQLLRERRCLLVLDNFETILEPGASDFPYRQEFAGYSSLLQAIAEASHHSCLVVTSREEPSELARLAGASSPVRVLRLGGLDGPTGQALLANKSLTGDTQTWGALVEQCHGNPLALQVTGELIATVFGRDIGAFLATGEAVFGDIRRVLEAQVARLSHTELNILYWLALEREAVGFETLVTSVGAGTPRHELLSALHALQRRSLLETGEDGARFTLQTVVLEYATETIVEAASAEILSRAPSLLVSHAMIKAQSEAYIRRSQERLVASALLRHLQTTRTDDVIERALLDLLDHWRGMPPTEQGYGPGNVVNLLRILRGNLRGLNLSHLTLRQADLSAVDAQDVSLAKSRLQEVVLAQQVGAAVSAKLSPDGGYVGVGTLVGEVRVWRLADRSPVLLVGNAGGPTWDVAVTRNGELVASGSRTNAVSLWQPGTSDAPSMLTGDMRGVYCVAFSGDGRTVAAGTGDGTARLWDAQTRECIGVVDCHRGGVRGLALSHDGKLLATGGADGGAGVWDLSEGGRLLHTRTFAGEGRGVALSSDGRILVNADTDVVVHVRDGATGETRLTLHGHEGPVWTVALAANGRLLASGGADRTLRLWNTVTGECRRVLHDHTAGLLMSSLSADGRLASSVTVDGSLSIWDTRNGRCLVTSRGNIPSVFEVALGADGSRIVSGCGDGSVRIWDTIARRCEHELRGHGGAVWAVDCSADGNVVVSGSLDRTIRVWDALSGTCRAVLEGHVLGVTTVALSVDRGLIVSGGFDGTIRFWDLATGDCRAVQECHVAGVRCVRFSGSGDLVVSGELDGTVRVWNARNAQCVKVLKGAGREIRALAISADDRLVACAELGGPVRVWEIASGTCTCVIGTASVDLRALAFAASRKLIGGGVDGSLRVWDSASGALEKSLLGHIGEVWGVAVRGDNHLIASGGFDGTVRLWDLAAKGDELCTLRPDRPYERVDITGLSGVNDTQRRALLALGATES